MTTYKEAGVNILEGDKASETAYEAAKATFSSRKGMIGEPVADNGGFSGLLDMGDYYLVQNDDGVGTKIAVAEKANKYETLGYDLVCMVADDAICLGAEVISITNTIDADKVDSIKIGALMEGLKKAAIEQKIVIPGGEIAELGNATSGYIWNATAVGIVEKNKVITGKSIEPGDTIIGLFSPGFRSNGFSLVRYILENSFGKEYQKEYFGEKSYAEAVLTPSTIFHGAILELHGRYGEQPKMEIKAIAHITGGGLPGNVPRVFKKENLGADITAPFDLDPIVKKIQELGKVDDREAYETWNMGVGMILVCNDFDTVKKTMSKHNIRAEIIGKISDKPGIRITSKGSISPGTILEWLE